MRLSNILLGMFFFISCSSINQTTGSYKVITSGVEKNITVNKNKTFSFLSNADVCPINVYGGYWEKTGRSLTLNYLWPKMSHFKNDTILFGKTAESNNIHVTIIENGILAADSVQIKINELNDTFYSNRNGTLYLNRNIALESIKVRKNKILNQWTEFSVMPGYNNLLIILYEKILEPCGFNYLPTEFRINKKGLLEVNKQEQYKRFN